MAYSNSTQRPNGLMSIPGNNGSTIEWWYKAPTTGETVHVATFNHKDNTITLTCKYHQVTKTTSRCIRAVFEDLLGPKLVSCKRQGDKFNVNGQVIPFDTPVQVFATMLEAV